jgi:hypothetical protein
MTPELRDTIRDLIARLPPECQATAVWFANWHDAWDYCQRRGWCDSYGGHEYRCLTHQALGDGLAPYQTAMRTWIRMAANLPPLPQPEKTK